MKYKFGNKYTKIISLLVLIVFLFILLNNIFFLHSHTLSDGTIIYHAHPYQKSSSDNSKEKHHHTGLDYIILQQFQTFSRNEPVTFRAFNLFYGNLYFNFSVRYYIHEIDNITTPRAPPQ